ncbi:hypothetical protein Q3G72_023486 [Acer saccharum]|nr:hypothetical protein Q3G72_023486 [Acer saccharum]
MREEGWVHDGLTSVHWRWCDGLMGFVGVGLKAANGRGREMVECYGGGGREATEEGEKRLNDAEATVANKEQR